MRKTSQRAAPVQTSPASKTINMYIITASTRGAASRAKLTPTQRGRFWQSVDEAIEAERAKARSSKGVSHG